MKLRGAPAFVGTWFLIATVALGACAPGREPAYASLRQAREQEVPGTWGLVLQPPPSDFYPSVSPRRAYDIAVPPGATPPGAVLRTLALVPGSFAATSEKVGPERIPAWVFLFRNLCFASAKGELVSSSRRKPSEVGPRCTEHNLWVELVDARTGDQFASLSGYDVSGTWVPAVGAG